MAQFVGKWKTDTSSYVNFDEYFKASGFNDSNMIQTFKTAESWASFKKNDDGTWTCLYDSGIKNEGEKVIPFTPGIQAEHEFLGKKVKFVIDFDSDSKMTETEWSELIGWKETKIVREVTGDIMKCTHTMGDTEMTAIMRRVK